VYGVGLGAVAALHIKVTTVFHGEKVVWRPDMPVKAAVMMLLGGLSALTGLIISAIVIENVESGVKIVACGSSGNLVLGGASIAFARWRRCRKLFVTI
jgi:ABC-type branched-subunit amino acid transport system permease subunit